MGGPARTHDRGATGGGRVGEGVARAARGGVGAGSMAGAQAGAGHGPAWAQTIGLHNRCGTLCINDLQSQ